MREMEHDLKWVLEATGYAQIRMRLKTHMRELRRWLKENERFRPDDDFEVKRIKEILRE